VNADSGLKPMRGAGATFEVNGRRVGRASWGPQDVDSFCVWIDGHPYIYQRPVTIKVEASESSIRVLIGEPPVYIDTNAEGEGALRGLVDQFNAYPGYLEESTAHPPKKATTSQPKESPRKPVRNEPENGDLFD